LHALILVPNPSPLFLLGKGLEIKIQSHYFEREYINQKGPYQIDTVEVNGSNLLVPTVKNQGSWKFYPRPFLISVTTL